MLGKNFQDRVLAAKVRKLTLEQIQVILEQPKMTELKKAVLLKLAGTILPRINETSGPDGGAIQVKGTIQFKDAIGA